ncbi:hypothetical protein ACFFGV_14485 [Pontibacillus salicampi]|uniref:Uncharacterized protein n=1 Tax=Pontibacillus salicampi TaxID=1449801 RepID=A0ABV6LQU3_9BACI
MWVSIFLFLTGFGFAVSGGVTIIAYLNFLPAGFGWIDYLLFIKTRPECYLLPFGIVLITVAMIIFPDDSC